MHCVRLWCGLWSDLTDHYHQTHGGFASVIAETEAKCAGDGVSVEVFETVLKTSARFLASEAKQRRR